VVESIPFDGVPQLSEKLVTLPDAQSCYVSQWFRFAEGRLNGDADKAYLDWLAKKFQPDTKVIDMVVEMVQSDNFRYLRTAP
jgi:hypothetical protein